jgi:hypothetical protein
MRLKTIVLALALVGLAPAANADQSCWRPDELKAYDITMQTLMLAEDASSCDATVKANPPLRADVANFLGKHGQDLDTARQPLIAYYKRAYGEDWQTPSQKWEGREAARVAAEVKQSAGPQFCTAVAQSIEALGTANWSAFVAQAQQTAWHEQAGFVPCK